MQNIEQFEDNSIKEYRDDDPELIAEKKLGNFSFLEVNEKINPFKYRVSTIQTSPSNFNFLDDRTQYSLIIPIIIENDSLSNSRKLRNTMNSLFLSLPELIQIGISNQNILICLFFLHFSSNKTFSQIYPNTDYLAACCTGDLDYNCSSCYIVSSTGIPINIISFNKNHSTHVECLKCFYLFILNDIKYYNTISIIEDEKKIFNNTFYILNWQNGIIPEKNTISNLIKTATEPMIIFPAVHSLPNNLFGEILEFYYLYIQIYSYYYYNVTSSCPIEHKFSLIKIDKKLYQVMKNYFTYYIYNDAELYYHDFKLGIFLLNNGYHTYYINQINVFYYERTLNFNEFMMNYCKQKSSYILIFFDLLNSFILWSNMNFFKFVKKIFLFFQLLELIIDFLYIGFTILIIFSFLSEAFIDEDERIVIFFTVIYSIMTICSCCFSLISPKENGRDKTFIYFHVFFYCYFIFFIISSLFAIIRISHNKNNYKFKSPPMILLIILNIIFIIGPSFFHLRKVIKNIFSGFKFFIITFPGLYSVFKFHYLINCFDLYGQSIYSKRKFGNRFLNERKKVQIFLFLISNSAIAFICFFLISTSRRIIFIYIIGILYTIINGQQFIAIIIGIIKLYFRKRNLIKFMQNEKYLNKIDTKDSLSATFEDDNKNNFEKNRTKSKEIEIENELEKEEEKDNEKSNIVLKKKSKKNLKNVNLSEMNIEQLKEYFGDLETKIEFSNLNKKNFKAFITPKRKKSNALHIPVINQKFALK